MQFTITVGGDCTIQIVMAAHAALGLDLNTERYVELMRKLIGEVEHLQNNPPRFIPEEDR